MELAMKIITFFPKLFLPYKIPPSTNSMILAMNVCHKLTLWMSLNLDMLVKNLVTLTTNFAEIEHIVTIFKLEED